MAEYGIVYLLPEAVGEYHERLRLDVEKRFSLTGGTRLNAPSHITMKYRFEAENISEVEGILSDFAKSQTKTSWSLIGFGRFINSDSYVIFVDVAASQAARMAHARLLKRLKELSWMQWGPYDNADLHYHVTIANRGITIENFDAVWDYVNHQPQPHFNLFFDNLALLKIESEIHTVYQQYYFRDS